MRIRTVRRSLQICVATTALLLLAGSRPGAATPRGYEFTDDNFTGDVPSGYRDASDFDPCEFRRFSRDGQHHQHIYSEDNDRCKNESGEPDPTNGAPGPGDVSIFKRFGAKPGEWYKAWAIGEMFAPNNARAVVKLLFRNDRRAIGECYGWTEDTSQDTFHTGEQRPIGLPKGSGREPPERSASGGCEAPKGTVKIAVAFRIHSRGDGASGQAILNKLRFGRCRDNGDCSNVRKPSP